MSFASGENDRAHVAAVRDQPSVPPGLPLDAKQPRTHGCEHGQPGRLDGDERRSQLLFEHPVSENRAKAFGGGLDPERKRVEVLRSQLAPAFGRDPGVEQRERESAVEGAGIEMAKPEPERDLPRRGRLPGARRPVERDDRARWRP